MTKKALVVVVLLWLILSFIGCSVKQVETTPQEQTKTVRIDSDP